MESPVPARRRGMPAKAPMGLINGARAGDPFERKRRRLPPAPERRAVTAYTTARAASQPGPRIDAPHLPADPVDAMQVRLLRRRQAQPFWPSSLPVALGCGEGRRAGRRRSPSRGSSTRSATSRRARSRRGAAAFGEILDAGELDLNHMYDEWRELLSAARPRQHLILNASSGSGSEPGDEAFGERWRRAGPDDRRHHRRARHRRAPTPSSTTAERVLARTLDRQPDHWSRYAATTDLRAALRAMLPTPLLVSAYAVTPI